MDRDGVNWQGLLKWSLVHSDGTSSSPSMSEEDRKWFMEAMQSQTVDVVGRMKAITLLMKTPDDVLHSQGITSADIVDVLDELQEHVESIDMANDLPSIGGLVPLLGYLKNPDPGIRAKASEVITTIVQNNPRTQQLVMEANGLEPLLLNFASDLDMTVRTKSLGAISSLVRHNRPGITAFRLANGYASLRDALGSENARFQRKALNMIQYLLHENKTDCGIVNELGFPRIMVHLASSTNEYVREAALGGLLELSREKESGSSCTFAEDDKLRQALEDRIQAISSMNQDDLGAAREERQLIDALWCACYNEPSSLREKGLLVLPGEETTQQPPDVIGKLFEPPLRAFMARPPVMASTTVSDGNKSQLLLGPPSSSESTATVSNSDQSSQTWDDDR